MKKEKRKPAPQGVPKGTVSIAVVLLCAIFFRVQFNDITEYSKADELFYTNYAKALHDRGVAAFPRLVSDYLENRDWWLFPHPARWGYILLAGGWMRIWGSTETRALASLSTLAGIVAVLVTYLIGLSFMPRRAAAVAAALSVTSPIQLAMGRRALQDEVHCAAILITFWLFLCSMREDMAPLRRALLVIAALASITFSLAIKESTLFVFPMLFVVLLLNQGWKAYKSPQLLLFVASPLLYIGGFLLLGGSIDQFLRIVHIVQGSGVLDNPYVPAYQAGPPHRVAIDFIALSPLVCFLAIAATGRLSAIPGVSRLPIFRLTLATLTLLLVFSILPSKNIRNFTMSDPFVRLLAAWGASDFVDRWQEWGSTVLFALVVANAIVELWIFQRVFIDQGVYDPVTYQLLRALRMIPSY